LGQLWLRAKREGVDFSKATKRGELGKKLKTVNRPKTGTTKHIGDILATLGKKRGDTTRGGAKGKGLV